MIGFLGKKKNGIKIFQLYQSVFAISNFPISFSTLRNCGGFHQSVFWFPKWQEGINFLFLFTSARSLKFNAVLQSSPRKMCSFISHFSILVRSFCSALGEKLSEQEYVSWQILYKISLKTNNFTSNENCSFHYCHICMTYFPPGKGLLNFNFSNKTIILGPVISLVWHILKKSSPLGG